ncbi:histone-lysine N-methyltransferase set-1-like [Amphiura filiformis]|uniref:histone-lysine N-methyltransferase set-1-like n=1 Tax=Amphiura filiformis TaxID=82378 RepID=UPI003B20FA65
MRAKMPNRRKSQENIAIDYCRSGTDRDGFEKRYISDHIGFGLFTTVSVNRGDFLLEYRGERSCVDDTSSDDEQSTPEPYVFYYDHMGETYRIDASHVDCGMARWINDQWKNPNSKMKKVLVNNTVHLCLFALTDIAAGKEIRYDYGVKDLPWRKEWISQLIIMQSWPWSLKMKA